MKWVEKVGLTAAAIVSLTFSACKKHTSRFIPSSPPPQPESFITLPSANNIQAFEFNYGGENHTGYIFKANDVRTVSVDMPSGNHGSFQPYYFISSNGNPDVNQGAGKTFEAKFFFAAETSSGLIKGGIPILEGNKYIIPVALGDINKEKIVAPGTSQSEPITRNQSSGQGR